MRSAPGHTCARKDPPRNFQTLSERSRAITFLGNQLAAGRVDYAAARRSGQPVGSGHVEASCKSLFNVRFKRNGASWCENNAAHVVNLRALVLSDRWDLAMELLREEARVEVRRAA